mgnify:CR=1 FL=1
MINIKIAYRNCLPKIGKILIKKYKWLTVRKKTLLFIMFFKAMPIINKSLMIINLNKTFFYLDLASS